MGKQQLEAAIASIAARQLGLVSRAQLLALGLSGRTIDKRVAAGRLYRRSRGVYVLPGVPRTWEQDVLAALLAGGPGSAVGSLSAGQLWRIEGLVSDRPQLVVAYGGGRCIEGVEVFRTRTLEARDVVVRPPFRVTSPARTLIDVAGVLHRDALEDALDDVLRRSLARYRELVERVGRLGRGVPGIGTLRQLLEERSRTRASDSSLENRFKRALRRAGLPEPVAQHEIRASDGRLIARVDFAYVAERIAIEVDGYAFHSGRKRWRSDLARQNRLVAAGWLPIRVTSDDVAGGGEALGTIATALNRRRTIRSK